MISEGPTLVEVLPGPLHSALLGALRPDEELLIAARAHPGEALAATPRRLLVLREKNSRVTVQEVALAGLGRVKVDVGPLGGKIVWDGASAGAPGLLEFPAFDSGKFQRVARRLQALIAAAGRSADAAPAANAPGGPSTPEEDAMNHCPHCEARLAPEGAWCPQCGRSVRAPCHECGRPLLPDARFCAYCGAPNDSEGIFPCEECGQQVRPGFAYCSGCGTPVRDACPSCPALVRKGWTFCPICGDDPNVEEEEEDPEEEGLPLRVDLPAAASISPAAAPRAGSAEALNQAGVRAYEAENYREAVRLFREASEADPSNSSYFTNLGVACGELDDDLGAFAAYLRAVDLNPQELQAYLNMGTLYAERERPVEAREVWERLIRIAPNSEEASEARENLRHIDYV